MAPPTPKMSKYMFDANQSLRISFEKLVVTAHVVIRLSHSRAMSGPKRNQ